MKTTIVKPQDIQRKWLLIDAKDKVLGRVAVQVSDILRGKKRVDFSPDRDMGDHVIIVNAGQIKLTGNKIEDKTYYRHTGYIGNLKQKTAKEYMEQNPAKMLEIAVKGMLPKNKLRAKMLDRLHVYAEAEHKHEAQQPTTVE